MDWRSSILGDQSILTARTGEGTCESPYPDADLGSGVGGVQSRNQADLAARGLFVGSSAYGTE